MSNQSGFNLKLKMNSAQKIIKDHGLDENGKITEFLRNEVDKFCDPYVPFAPGSGVHLKSNKMYPSNHEIKYVEPYSHYHYKGILMLAKNESSYAKKGEKKHYTGKNMNYQGEPKRRSRMG